MNELSQRNGGDVNYEQMYLTMARAAEKAIRLLIKAQQECEELYIKADTSIDEFTMQTVLRNFFGERGARQWMEDEETDRDLP